MNTDNYIDNLIATVLAGEATDAEVAQLEKWRQSSPENARHYDMLEKIFRLSRDVKPKDEFDTDAAWMKVKDQIGRKAIRELPAQPSGGSMKMFFRIAAVLLLVAGLSYTIYKVILPEEVIPVTLASGERIEELVLPDSTRVMLNKNSQLVYKFSSGKRIVELKGEAFLDLASDPGRPFELLAGTLNIRDIGTAFNVKAPENTDSVVVIVTDGELLLTSPGSKSITLLKGEQVIYYKQRDEFIKAAIADTNALAYKTKIFVFENASLEIVVKKLSEVYNMDITISENVSQCRLTATFQNETIENILEVISETLKLEVIKENGNVLLKGEFCEE